LTLTTLPEAAEGERVHCREGAELIRFFVGGTIVAVVHLDEEGEVERTKERGRGGHYLSNTKYLQTRYILYD
jgi:hypothetical protein